MKHGIRDRKNRQNEIAKERILKLFEEAEKNHKEEPKLAKRYVELARRIATRTNTRLPFSLKRKFCKNCNAYLVPGKNARIRVKNKIMIITCLECKAISKMAFGKGKEAAARQTAKPAVSHK
ncbi:MAG: ribonuclease P protein component 4 [Nanoarchaeota archaeon]